MKQTYLANRITLIAWVCSLFLSGYISAQPVNVAIGKTVTASSTANSGAAAKAVDGVESTYWESTTASTQTICVDLGKQYDVSKIVLKWNAQFFATSATILYSNTASITNADTDTVVIAPSSYSTHGPGPNTDVFGIDQERTGKHYFDTFTARYVAIRTRGRNNIDPYRGDRYKLNEFEIYGVEHGSVTAENDASLSEVSIDGVKLEEFNAIEDTYTYVLPYSYTNRPLINAVAKRENATVRYENATHLQGSETERTTKIVVVSADGTQSKTYNIVFSVLPELDLYLCIGQSNMAGRGTLVEASGDYIPLSDAYLLNDKGRFEPATNPMNRYSGIRKDLSVQRMGPSYSFVRKLVAETNKKIGVVVNARGGSNIEQWAKDSSTDTLYASSIRRALQANVWGTYKGIIWHQGESNATAFKVRAYPDQLKALVDNLRNDLNKENLFFVAGEVAYWTEGDGTVAFNQMIKTVDSFINHSTYVSAEGLTPLIDSSDPHFDRNSQIILGERYADAVLTNVYGSGTNSVQKIDSENEVKVYASTGKIRVEKLSDGKSSACIVHDLLGRVVAQENIYENKDISIENKGIYIVSINNVNQKVLIK